MPTSARWEVSNSPKIFIKTLHSAGPMRRPQASFEAQPRFARLLAPKMGIGPYNKTGKCMRMRPSFSKNRCILLDGQRRPPLHRLFFYKTVYH